MADLQHNICALAPPDDIPGARQACNDLCELNNDWQELMGGVWNPQFACESFGNLDDSETLGFTPVEVPEGHDRFQYCVPPPPVFLEGEVMPFQGDAILDVWTVPPSTFPMANVIIGGWLGVIDFSVVGPCVATDAACEVSITEIYAAGTDISAEYYDNSGSTAATIENPHIRLLQPVRGVWNQSSSSVTFPNMDMFLELSAGPTFLGSAQVNSGFNDFVVYIDSPFGMYDGTQLTLGLDWKVANVTLSAYFITQ